MTNVVISLLNYNSAEATIECLTSLDKISHSNLEVEIIVLDNNSKEKFVLPTREYKFPIEVIESDQNLGFAQGHNHVLKQAMSRHADFVLILNNDTVVDPDFLKILVKSSHEKNAGVVVPKIYFYPGDEFHHDRYTKHERGNVIWYAGGKMDWDNVIGSHIGVDEVDDKDMFKTAHTTEFATGACMLVSSQVLQDVDGFDARYFLYYEDADLSMRIKQKGYTVLFEPSARIWHKNAKSTGGSGSGLQDYFITRNRLLFGMRYAPLRTRVALISESLRLLRTGRAWQKVGVKDFYMRKFGKGSYPVR